MDVLAPSVHDSSREGSSLTLRIQRCESPRELMVGGELDIATAPELNRVLGTIPSDGDLTLDLTYLRFCDETGFRVIKATAERLTGSLVLVSPPSTLLLLLRLLLPLPKNLVIRLPDSEPVTEEMPDSERF